jgi:hypothetical protein
MTQIVVVLGESGCGSGLGQAVRRHTGHDALRTHFVVIAPCIAPRFGLVVYDDERHDAACGRLQLALASMTDAGLTASGVISDAGLHASVLDVVGEMSIREILVAQAAGPRAQGRERPALVHLRHATGLPVSTVTLAPGERSGGARRHALVVAAGDTAEVAALRERMAELDRARPHHFTVLMPLRESEDGGDRRRRMAGLIEPLQARGLSVSGVVGHPDPYTAIRNALASGCVDEIVIATHAATRPRWPHRDLVNRIRNQTTIPVADAVDVDQPEPGAPVAA